MDIKEISQRAVEIKEKYFSWDRKRTGRTWTREETMDGFIVDVGELMRLVMAKKGLRDEEHVDQKLAHELADCLWSILVLAHMYNVDIEKEFVKTMEELEIKITNALKPK